MPNGAKMTSLNGFVVIETYKHDTTRIRVWMFNSDVDANRFTIKMQRQYPGFRYEIKRADVVEI